MDKPKQLRPSNDQRFPFIALPKALERARELYKIANVHGVPVSTAVKAWGYGDKSSGGMMTVATLKMFGLLADSGSGAGRKVQLTDEALKIVRDPRQDSPDRDALIREVALTPPIHSKIHDLYDGMPPSEEALKAHLLMDLGMRDDAVDDFIREFYATMSFAGFSESDTIQDMEQKDDQELKDSKTGGVMDFTPPALRQRAVTVSGQFPLNPTSENDIKVLLDGRYLRVAAWVDRTGLKKLQKILAANEALLDDEGTAETGGTKEGSV